MTREVGLVHLTRAAGEAGSAGQLVSSSSLSRADGEQTLALGA